MEALKIHDALDRLLTQGPIRGQVHSVFQKALNIIDEENHLYTLLTSEMDDGPLAVTLSLKSFEESPFIKDQRILMTREELSIPGHRIPLENASRFSLLFPPYDPSPWCYRLIQETENILERENQHGDSPYERAVEKLLHERLMDLTDAFQKEDEDQILSSSKKLIGLGPGLTPSGDDVLLGMMLVLNLPGNPYEKYLPLFDQVLLEARDETNLLSFHGLARAREGFVRRNLLDFIKAILREKEIEKEREQVRSIGHTSGQDILLGVLSLLKICLEKEK